MTDQMEHPDRLIEAQWLALNMCARDQLLVMSGLVGFLAQRATDADWRAAMDEFVPAMIDLIRGA